MSAARDSSARAFAAQGWCLLADAAPADEVQALLGQLPSESRAGAGTRQLLAAPWCAALARRLGAMLVARQLLPATGVAVQCTLFDKSGARNWLVPWHQDTSIPACGGAREAVVKEGECHVQPGPEVLASLVAVRLHLDDCGPEAGPLRVISGSHRCGLLDPERIAAMRTDSPAVTCIARAGDALVLRPLLLHASSRLRAAHRRRVLHFLFGPADLPDGLAWNRAVTADDLIPTL